MQAGEAARPLRVWIDLSNSPHPLLFAPVARELESAGHTVMLTARAHAQTVELARERWPAVDVLGEESPPGRVAKARTLAARVAGLRSWARRHGPDVALSHNSYAQIVAARLSGVPAVTAMDFEHQPANHLAFRLARSILLPEAFPEDLARRQGASGAKVHRYQGIKEALYVGDFEPDPQILEKLGAGERGDRALVVVRTPPSRALYHRTENRLFVEVLGALGAQPGVLCVVLTRHGEQDRELGARLAPNCLIPRHAIDARSLMYAADLVIGAGGTMTREAALMGIPTFSVFAGEQPAVDRSLERARLLNRLDHMEQIRNVSRRTADPRSIAELRRLADTTRTTFTSATLAAGGLKLPS